MKTSGYILINTHQPQAGLPPERFLAVEKEKTFRVTSSSTGVPGFKGRYTSQYRKLLVAITIAIDYDQPY